MSEYTKQEWQDDNTLPPYGQVNADRLGHIEQGIFDAASTPEIPIVVDGVTIATRNGVNLIGGDGVTLDAADDTDGNKVDVTINSVAQAATDPYINVPRVTTANRPVISAPIAAYDLYAASTTGAYSRHTVAGTTTQNLIDAIGTAAADQTGPTGPDGVTKQGVVYVPAGTYTWGSVTPLSNVRIEFDPLAVIKPAAGIGQMFLLHGVGTPLSNFTLTCVGTAAAGAKESGSWAGRDTTSMFTYDMSGTAAPIAAFVRMKYCANIEISQLYSIQDSGSSIAVVVSPGDWANSTPNGPYLRPTNVTYRDHYNVGSPYSYGPNQLQSCSGMTVNRITSRGGCAFRVETDGDGAQGANQTARVDNMVADDIVVSHGSRAVLLNPHFQHNGIVTVTNINAIGSDYGYQIFGSTGGYFDSTSSIKNGSVQAGTAAQHADNSIGTSHAIGQVSGTIGYSVVRDKIQGLFGAASEDGATNFLSGNTAGAFTSTGGPYYTASVQPTTVVGWGAAATGQTWAYLTGASTDYSKDAGVGKIQHTAANQNRRVTLPISLADIDATIDMAVPVTPAGGNLLCYLTGRVADASNWYGARVTFSTTGSVVCIPIKTVGGTATTFGSSTTVYSSAYPAGSFVTVRLQLSGTAVRMKAWPTANAQPVAWASDSTDSSISAAGSLGVHSFTNTGNTNTAPQIYVDNLYVNGGATNLSSAPMVFDLTLGKPIWWDVANWKDATGASV